MLPFKIDFSGNKVFHVVPGAQAFLLSQLWEEEKHRNNGQVVVITNSNAQADYLSSLLEERYGKELVNYCPDWETLAYDQFSPSAQITSDRINFLQKLGTKVPGLYIIAVQSALHRLAPLNYLITTTNYHLNQERNQDEIKDDLIKAGYREVEVVYEPGEFSVISRHLDFFPIGSTHPYRISFFEGQIERIRKFDSEEQNIIADVEEIAIKPGNEYPQDSNGRSIFLEKFKEYFGIVNSSSNSIYGLIADGILAQGAQYYLPLFFRQETSSLSDFISFDTTVVNFTGYKEIAQAFLKENELRYRERKDSITWPPMRVESLYIDEEELFTLLREKTNLITFSENFHSEDKSQDKEASEQRLHREEKNKDKAPREDLLPREKREANTGVNVNTSVNVNADAEGNAERDIEAEAESLLNLDLDFNSLLGLDDLVEEADNNLASAQENKASLAGKAKADSLASYALDNSSKADFSQQLLAQARKSSPEEELLPLLVQQRTSPFTNLGNLAPSRLDNAIGKTDSSVLAEQATIKHLSSTQKLLNLGLNRNQEVITGDQTLESMTAKVDNLRSYFCPAIDGQHQLANFVNYLRKVAANFSKINLLVTIASEGRATSFDDLIADLKLKFSFREGINSLEESREAWNDFWAGNNDPAGDNPLPNPLANAKGTLGKESKDKKSPSFKKGNLNCRYLVSKLKDGCAYFDEAKGEAWLVVSEQNIIGSYQARSRYIARSKSKNVNQTIQSLLELRPNQLLVHQIHGICRYLGLETKEIVAGHPQDFFSLEFADSNMLLNVTDLHLLSIYSQQPIEGVERSQLSAISGRGSKKWLRQKEKALDSIRDMAANLLEVQANRELEKGFVFKIFEKDYREFCSRFKYEETPDQFATIQDVLEDMASEKKMDRLICGDVGFGKTEIAMRAAFIAILNGKQVAVLVPTTLLAQQHYESFRDRFAFTGAEIALLSRFNTAKKNNEIIDKINRGAVDIVIGTHSLLQDKIKFKDLGLLIIDEEHQFGVRQKEMIKEFKSNIDVLNMTATPIPRTLNMALNGLRDISLIATAPQSRLSIVTNIISRADNKVIKEAINREIMRGGQVFFIHNDLRDMEFVKERLQELVPHARITTGNGQMPAHELEKAMMGFHNQRYNVLVCSTIIETGIDVPNANTIIINNAQNFGLAQLHQLRGRVGRSYRQAYAYLTVPNPNNLNGDASLRLKAMTDIDSLGAGYLLATHDLEIRGAGEILGQEQSGKVDTIGYSLYMSMLRNAVKALKAEKEITAENLLDKKVEVSLGSNLVIPATYIAAPNVRVFYYRQISNAQSEMALDEIANNMIERFGSLPESLKCLLKISKLRVRIQDLGIESIKASNRGVIIAFENFDHLNVEKINALILKYPKLFSYSGKNLLIKTQEKNFHKKINLIAKILNQVMIFREKEEEVFGKKEPAEKKPSLAMSNEHSYGFSSQHHKDESDVSDESDDSDKSGQREEEYSSTLRQVIKAQEGEKKKVRVSTTSSLSSREEKEAQEHLASTVANSPVKRGRGRPPKKVQTEKDSAEEMENKEDNSISTLPLKRGPGRPRKEALDSALSREDIIDSVKKSAKESTNSNEKVNVNQEQNLPPNKESTSSQTKVSDSLETDALVAELEANTDHKHDLSKGFDELSKGYVPRTAKSHLEGEEVLHDFSWELEQSKKDGYKGIAQARNVKSASESLAQRKGTTVHEIYSGIVSQSPESRGFVTAGEALEERRQKQASSNSLEQSLAELRMEGIDNSDYRPELSEDALTYEDYLSILSQKNAETIIDLITEKGTQMLKRAYANLDLLAFAQRVSGAKIKSGRQAEKALRKYLSDLDPATVIKIFEHEVYFQRQVKFDFDGDSDEEIDRTVERELLTQKLLARVEEGRKKD